MSIDKKKIYNQALTLRSRFNIDDESPIDIFALVQNIHRLSLVLYPFEQNISGMCVKIDGDAIIAVNSSMSIGRQNFSIAHELYHYYFDNNDAAICYREIGNGSDLERSADQFAAYFLMPLKGNVFNCLKGKITPELVIKLGQYYKVSNQSLLYRLRNEGIITPEQAEEYRQGIIHRAEALGYDTALYKPSRCEKKYGTYGHYIQQAQSLLEQDIISEGKYEELLLFAFRDDIVYGINNFSGGTPNE